MNMLTEKVKSMRKQAIEAIPDYNQNLARWQRLRELIPSAKTIIFDSGKYDGELTAEQEAEFDARMEKFNRWCEEYQSLCEILFPISREVKNTIKCDDCGRMILVAWNTSRQCDKCGGWEGRVWDRESIKKQCQEADDYGL